MKATKIKIPTIKILSLISIITDKFIELISPAEGKWHQKKNQLWGIPIQTCDMALGKWNTGNALEFVDLKFCACLFSCNGFKDKCGFFPLNKGQLLLRKLTDQNKIDGHYHSILVHIFFKFPEFVPAS